jgi:hypothetical protein
MGLSDRGPHWLTRLYPKEWRARYGDELDALIEQEGHGWREVVDVVKAAATERMHQVSRAGVEAMKAHPANIGVFVRKPSAIVPIAMSICASATVLFSIAVVGAKREPDEGAAAHILQLLMAGQLPFVAWFALNWLKRDFRAGLTIVGLQLGAIAAALFPVWYLGL